MLGVQYLVIYNPAKSQSKIHCITGYTKKTNLKEKSSYKNVQ